MRNEDLLFSHYETFIDEHSRAGRPSAKPQIVVGCYCEVAQYGAIAVAVGIIDYHIMRFPEVRTREMSLGQRLTRALNTGEGHRRVTMLVEGAGFAQHLLTSHEQGAIGNGFVPRSNVTAELIADIGKS